MSAKGAKTRVDAEMFDWNGTLIDDAPQAAAATAATLSAFDVARRFGLDELHATFELPLTSWFHNLGVPAEALDTVVSRWNLEMATRPAELRRGVIGALKALQDHGVPTSIISAASADVIESDLERLGIAELVDHLQGDVADKHADSHRWAEVVYLGDTEYDMSEATIAGVTPIGIAHGYRPRSTLLASGAVDVLEDLSALPEIAGFLR